MMKLTVRQVAEAKGYRNAKELGDAAGIPNTSMYRIWKGTATRIDLATLDKLCTLLDVPVGMLIQHIPDKDIEARGSHGAPARKPERVRGSKSETRKATSLAVAA